MFPGGRETSMGTSYHSVLGRLDLVSKIYSHSVVHKCLCFWSELMFFISLHFVFAEKPAGTRELSEVEEVEMDEIPQEVPSLGRHIELKA